MNVPGSFIASGYFRPFQAIFGPSGPGFRARRALRSPRPARVIPPYPGGEPYSEARLRVGRVWISQQQRMSWGVYENRDQENRPPNSRSAYDEDPDEVPYCRKPPICGTCEDMKKFWGRGVSSGVGTQGAFGKLGEP